MPANARAPLRRGVVAEAVGTGRLVGIDTTPELRRTLAYERLTSRPGSDAERVGWSNGTQWSSGQIHVSRYSVCDGCSCAGQIAGRVSSHSDAAWFPQLAVG